MKHLFYTLVLTFSSFFSFSQGTSNPTFFVHADKPSSYSGSGTTWSDISGNGHHGTITGATFDPSNKVFVFDGNDKVNFPAVLNAGDDTYTLEAYFKNTSASGTQVVFEQNTLSSQANKRACMILLSNGNGGFNGQNNDRHSQLSYTSNQWEHWVIVANSSSNVLKMYRNGSLSYNGTFANAGALNVGDGGLSIGYKLSTNGEYFIGEIKFVRIYDRVLTNSEVLNNYSQRNQTQICTTDFNYGGSTTFCNNESNPVATITGVVDGEFSSSTGLALDAVTGAINLSGSVAGSYDVSYSPPLNFAQMGVDIDGYASDDRFGTSVALNKAGDVMVVGAQLNDAGGSNAGQVRVYSWNGTAWSQLGDSINGEGGDDRFGYSVSINGAGDRIVVGALQNDAGGSNAGHARIYSYNNGVWTQLGSDINGDAVNDKLGWSVDMNEAGDRVVVAIREHDNTVGGNAGATRIFEYQTNDWVQLGSDIFGERANDVCEAVAMNDLGNRVIIGSRYANGPQNQNDRGHARVFEYVNSAWVQMGADIDAPDGNYFGYKLDMNGAGDKVVVGNYFHNS